MDKRTINGWCWYDFGNSAFAVIFPVIYGTFYAESVVKGTAGVRWWGYVGSTSMLLVALLSEMAKGKTLEEAGKITNKSAMAEALQGLPKNKLHCSNLGADALHLAIQDYHDRKAGKISKEPKATDPHIHTHGDKCYCPYCDVEVSEKSPVCVNCGRALEAAH